MANGNQSSDSETESEEAVEDVTRGCFGYGVILVFFTFLLVAAVAVIIRIFG